MSKEGKAVREEGLYAGRLFDYYVNQSSGGHPQVVLVWEIFGRYKSLLDSVGDVETCYVFTRRMYWPVTLDRTGEEGEIIPGTAGRVLADLRHLGFQGESILELKRDAWQPDHGEVHQLECLHDTWEGNLRERWSVFRPIDHSDPKRLEAFEQLRRLFEDGQKRKPRRKAASQKPVPEPEANGVPA